MADQVSRSSFSLLTKRASKSMIGAMLSGPDRHVNEARGGEVRRSSLLLYARRGVLLLCNYCPVLRGLDLSTVRARPCEVVGGFDEAFEDV